MVRLFTDAYFIRSSVAGYGLWNVSRGLARHRDEYRRHLAAADEPRVGNLDGRGNLSNRTLTEFCEYFLRVCLDQANYMDDLLALGGFLERLERYVRLRADGVATGRDGKLVPLRRETAKILRAVAVAGAVTRGEAVQLIEMSERTGRNELRRLLAEGLLVAESEKDPVSLGFPAHAAGYWFAELYPAEVSDK